MVDKCSACGGEHHLRSSPWHGDAPICRPCFMIWYEENITVPSELGKRSLELKAANAFPWNQFKETL